MSMRRLVLLLSSATVLSCAYGAPEPARFDGLGAFLDSLMLEHDVPGVSFAVFDDGGQLYEYVGGLKSQDAPDPIERGTAFEAASISKPVFSYVVFSLAREGVLDLDASLSTLVSEVPEVAYDPRSVALTARTLLTHQGGLPNWRSRMDFLARSYADLFAPDDTLRFVADPGTEYRYSGEGFVLLQRIVEEVTGQALHELAGERVFGPLGMTASSVVFDTDMERNYPHGHDREGSPDKWDLRLALASSTLHTTGSDLAKFGAHLASEIRQGGPFSALATPAATIEVIGGVTRSWGLGVGVVDDGPRRYVYHGGNNVIFIADFMYGVEENLGYALLTNSANGQRMVEPVERRIFGRDVPR